MKTSYRMVIETFDWGPAVEKLVVDLGGTANAGSVDAGTFRVRVVRTDPRPGVKIKKSDAEGGRTVAKAYVSDRNGDAADKGKYAAIELTVGPEIELGSPINYDDKSGRQGWVECRYTITQQKDIAAGNGKISGLAAQKQSGETRELADDFKTGSYRDAGSGIALAYACYAPPESSRVKHPLIVWLHGTDDIGTDPTIPLNKTCRLASQKIQSCFGGAYILAPQCPTMWGEGPVENALMALIKDYVSQNGDIDKDRIYVGGHSNGGYMTMILARDYAGYFAAAAPACEAMPDRLLSDSDIRKMKGIPIWFTVAKTDTIVPPDACTLPTYNRLKKAGANNVHLSCFDKVVDTTGLYRKADGTPFEYDGHCSFYYVFRNECRDQIGGKETTIMQWLAAQSRSKPSAVQARTQPAAAQSAPKRISVPAGMRPGNPFGTVGMILAIAAVAAAATLAVLLVLKVKKRR